MRRNGNYGKGHPRAGGRQSLIVVLLMCISRNQPQLLARRANPRLHPYGNRLLLHPEGKSIAWICFNQQHILACNMPEANAAATLFQRMACLGEIVCPEPEQRHITTRVAGGLPWPTGERFIGIGSHPDCLVWPNLHRIAAIGLVDRFCGSQQITPDCCAYIGI
jgi:hypothetical protein